MSLNGMFFVSPFRGAFFVWRAPILSWPKIMRSQERMLKFLDALASLDSKLSVSQWVINVFRVAHLRVFQSYFDSVKYDCFIRLCKMRHSLQSWNQDRVIRIDSPWPQDYLREPGILNLSLVRIKKNSILFCQKFGSRIVWFFVKKNHRVLAANRILRSEVIKIHLLTPHNHFEDQGFEVFSVLAADSN